MSTGVEFREHRPHGEDARPDERHVRILLVESEAVLAEELRQSLTRASRASFEVICESDVVEAATFIRGEHFDLVLMDMRLPGVDRSAAIELANDLAHRLPVVVLTGTEAVDPAVPTLRDRLSACVDRSDVAGKLLAAIRRGRRLGTGVMTPIFCRLEGL